MNFFYRPQAKFGVFVCPGAGYAQSTCRQTRGGSPQPHRSWMQTPPLDANPPRCRTPLMQTPPPGCRTPPTPPRCMGYYGQQAAGTHPTGMHFCLSWFKIAGVAHCYDSHKSLTVPMSNHLHQEGFAFPIYDF